MPYLNPSQIETFKEDGYLVIPEFADAPTLQKLKQAAKEIVDAFYPAQLKVFTTENQSSVLDEYFINSAAEVRCFFEEAAFDADGKLKQAKELAVNKIGHALHDRVKVYEEFSYQPAFLEMGKELGLSQPVIVQSQYIFKQPNIGAKVNPHTDSTFLHTIPLSCLGAWLALEPATLENGCLQFIPGSHRDYPLQELYVLDEKRTGTKFIKTAEKRAEWPLQKLKPVEVEAGSLVLLSGEVVHASGANRSAHSRQSYILHMVDGACKWSVANWLQRPVDFPFRSMEAVLRR